MTNRSEEVNQESLRRQILVVDDEMLNRRILGDNPDEVYDVLYASDGAEALEQIRKNKDTLSLVLLDLMMPVMSGQEVLGKIKEDQSTARIPVIVLTADPGEEQHCLELGAVDFLTKPYPPPSIVRLRVMRTIELSEDREIIRAAERDPLTGLYNREFFYQYAEQYDHHHRKQDMDAVVLDLSRFHMINERFGTEYGDRILQRAAACVDRMISRSGGLACRRASDTFLIYCPSRNDYDEVIKEFFSDIPEGASDRNRVRVRMGVYPKADRSLNIDLRFDRAQIAANTVRNSYARAVGYYDEALHKKELYEEQLIEEFSGAIGERQFKVFFQPKFVIRPDQRVLSSAEALVRWVHPELGMISPGVFIPLFEKNGLIRTLDHYVWRKTAESIREWKERYGAVPPVSVNVSRVDMYDPDLIEAFRDILSEHALTPDELLLEITESAYTENSGQIVETVKELRDLGFRIEMDDFGTGYSFLNMISSLPIDVLKMDMQFIRSAFGQNKETWLLEVIISIAKYLNVPVVAEGVETKEQLDTLREMGCDFVQGYYFSKPVPAEEYEVFLREYNSRGEAAE